MKNRKKLPPPKWAHFGGGVRFQETTCATYVLACVRNSQLNENFDPKSAPKRTFGFLEKKQNFYFWQYR